MQVFEHPGKENAGKALELALRKAIEIDAPAVVLPSGTGETGVLAAELAQELGYKGQLVVVRTVSKAALSGGNFMKALSGVSPEGKPQMYHLGHFFFVVDPEAFAGGDTFRKTAGDICRALRASAKAPGYDRIYTAGEKEYLTWLERKDKGVPVGEAVQKEMIALRDKHSLPYRFPFEN